MSEEWPCQGEALESWNLMRIHISIRQCFSQVCCPWMASVNARLSARRPMRSVQSFHASLCLAGCVNPALRSYIHRTSWDAVFSACSFSFGYVGAVLLPWKGSHHHRCPLYLSSVQLCPLSVLCLLSFISFVFFKCLSKLQSSLCGASSTNTHTHIRQGRLRKEIWLVEKWMRYHRPLSPFHINRRTGWSSIRCYVDSL